MRILIVGDTHGNTNWLSYYIYPVAMALECDKIIVLGDFGYWEHTDAGVEFLDRVDSFSADCGIPLYWLHGNHDKHSLALKSHGERRDDEGFILCRDNVLYIPQGHAWAWEQRTFRSFGGAYSVDKSFRLKAERRNYEFLLRKEQYRAEAAGTLPRPVPSQAGTLWFPEEQMSDEDMDELLAADSELKNYVLSHDKPLNARPRWNRKDIAACEPNQRRLQRALEAHQPTHWFHGHLHYRYQDLVRSGPDTATTVIGLDPDTDAAEFDWHPTQTWVLLDLRADGTDGVIPGDDEGLILPPSALEDARLQLS